MWPIVVTPDLATRHAGFEHQRGVDAPADFDLWAGHLEFTCKSQSLNFSRLLCSVCPLRGLHRHFWAWLSTLSKPLANRFYVELPMLCVQVSQRCPTFFAVQKRLISSSCWQRPEHVSRKSVLIQIGFGNHHQDRSVQTHFTNTQSRISGSRPKHGTTMRSTRNGAKATA